ARGRPRARAVGRWGSAGAGPGAGVAVGPLEEGEQGVEPPRVVGAAGAVLAQEASRDGRIEQVRGEARRPQAVLEPGAERSGQGLRHGDGEAPLATPEDVAG